MSKLGGGTISNACFMFESRFHCFSPPQALNLVFNMFLLHHRLWMLQNWRRTSCMVVHTLVHQSPVTGTLLSPPLTVHPPQSLRGLHGFQSPLEKTRQAPPLSPSAQPQPLTGSRTAPRSQLQSTEKSRAALLHQEEGLRSLEHHQQVGEQLLRALQQHPPAVKCFC